MLPQTFDRNALLSDTNWSRTCTYRILNLQAFSAGGDIKVVAMQTPDEAIE